jgi:hypothetical protein
VRHDCDDDLMVAAAIVVAWREGAPTDEGAETEATRLRPDMQAVATRACRELESQGEPGYWWSGEIARLRERCSKARCQYTRACRRRLEDEEMVARVYDAHREARRFLKRAISQS